jgi:hypothetical protein
VLSNGVVRVTPVPSPPPPALVWTSQRPVVLAAVQVKVMRAHIIKANWRETLPAWLVEAIGNQVVGIHWERTRVTLAHGAGEFHAAADDWIVLMPDGTLAVYTPENYAFLLQVMPEPGADARR